MNTHMKGQQVNQPSIQRQEVDLGVENVDFIVRLKLFKTSIEPIGEDKCRPSKMGKHNKIKI